MDSSHKSALYVALVALLAAIVLFATGKPAGGGYALVAFFLLASFAVRGSEKFAGVSFSLLIFAAVSLAMTYPSIFVSWGDFRVSKLIVPLLQIIMFGMGTAMSAKDFIGVVKSPKAVFVGLAAQFTIMPFVGALLALIFDLGPEVAAGIVLIGSVPSGLASNVMVYIAKANLPLSVTLTSVATLLAPFVTPFYMQWLAGQYIEINPMAMMWDIIKITIIPIAAGLLFNRFLHGRTAWLDRAMPLLSMGGIVMILAVMTAGARDNLLVVGAMLVVVALMHNLSGYLIGYWSCRLLRFDEKSCRTIAIEVGLQNAGLATGLAQTMGKMATVGLAPTVFGSLMNITGATLANWWRGRPVRGEDTAK